MFICARGVSENWRYCSVTSSDSVTPRRFSTTPTTRCCLGCGPTAPPTCRGTGTHPATFMQPHSTSRQAAESLPTLTYRHPTTTVTTGTYRTIHSAGVQRKSSWLFSELSAWMCCVSYSVSLMLIWDHCVQAPLLLCIFVCLAHSLAICAASCCSLTGVLFLSSSFFPVISIVSFPCPPSSILHLFSGRQKFHAGLFFKPRAVLVDQTVSIVREDLLHLIHNFFSINLKQTPG